MQAAQFDIVVSGGGLAGASVAASMAQAGARVLVLEREERFRDRIRGEWLAPWGVAALRRLGLVDVVESAGAVYEPHQINRAGRPRRIATPEGEVAMAFHHPSVQEAMLRHAEQAGARVVRGARVRTIEPGSPASVTYDGGQTVSARLVVGADGRSSLARKALGHDEREHRAAHFLAGVRVGNLSVPDDTGYFLIRNDARGLTSLFPHGDGYGRAYVFLDSADPTDFRGDEGFRRFLQMAVDCGIPAEVLRDATQAGPLGAFTASETWVDRPAGNGIALVGDAAGISDPTWGMGMALAFQDAVTLRDAFAGSGDWDVAQKRYAAQRDRYFQAIVNVENWHTELLLTPGDAAAARRRHAARQWKLDPTRLLDLPGYGPQVDASESGRRRFFGEDVPVTVEVAA